MNFNDIIKTIGIEPYYRDNHIKVYNKSCTDMSELQDNSIQCVVTSPPYWGLRRYAGNQDLIWGGDKNCEHIFGIELPRAGYRSNDSHPGKLQNIATQNRNIGSSSYCQICNAWKGSFGLEPTPELYVAHSIEILREIKRVLRPDGVVFWNIGDSYFASGGAGGDYNNGGLKESRRHITRQLSGEYKIVQCYCDICKRNHSKSIPIEHANCINAFKLNGRFVINCDYCNNAKGYRR